MNRSSSPPTGGTSPAKRIFQSDRSQGGSAHLGAVRVPSPREPPGMDGAAANVKIPCHEDKHEWHTAYISIQKDGRRNTTE